MHYSVWFENLNTLLKQTKQLSTHKIIKNVHILIGTFSISCLQMVPDTKNNVIKNNWMIKHEPTIIRPFKEHKILSEILKVQPVFIQDFQVYGDPIS